MLGKKRKRKKKKKKKDVSLFLVAAAFTEQLYQFVSFQRNVHGMFSTTSPAYLAPTPVPAAETGEWRWSVWPWRCWGSSDGDGLLSVAVSKHFRAALTPGAVPLLFIHTRIATVCLHQHGSATPSSGNQSIHSSNEQLRKYPPLTTAHGVGCTKLAHPTVPVCSIINWNAAWRALQWLWSHRQQLKIASHWCITWRKENSGEGCTALLL